MVLREGEAAESQVGHMVFKPEGVILCTDQATNSASLVV